MSQLYKEQTRISARNVEQIVYRPLEGFVFALTPFNFTSICKVIPCAAPAMLGNVVVWNHKTQIYSAQIIMELFQAAGLPDGVINMITVSGSTAGKVIFEDGKFWHYFY